MKNILLLIIATFICIIAGCGQESISINNHIKDFSDEQIEALERLDPLHLLTDNEAVFSLTKKEILNDLDDKIDMPDGVQQVHGGYLQLEHFEGCSEPILLRFFFYGSGNLASVAYGLSNYSNSTNVIQNYPKFLTQIREDMVTLYGDNYNEAFIKTDCQSFEEMIQLVKDNKAVWYALYFSSNAQLFIMLGEGAMDGTMESFNIGIFLDKSVIIS